MNNSAQLPKPYEDSFFTTTNYPLTQTGEVSLTNMVADMIFSREKLPIRYTAFTPCFHSRSW